jgi:hypothetical protein
MFNENELNLAVVFKLVRVLREQKGISRLTVSMPQNIDPFDAPIWIAQMFPNWTIDGIEIVSPHAEGFEQ